MTELDIKQESYFTYHFKIFGGILILGCFLILVTQELNVWKVLLSAIFFGSGLLMTTSYYGLKINVEQRTYTIYTWILGFKTGTPERFNYIEKFYLNEVSNDAVLTSRAGLQYDIRNKVFKIFMKLDNGEKIHVDTDKNRERLKSRMNEYIQFTKSIQIPSE